jgi:hypothetical protein
MPPVGFEPMIPISARPQTYALDRAAAGTGIKCDIWSRNMHLLEDIKRQVCVHLLRLQTAMAWEGRTLFSWL